MKKNEPIVLWCDDQKIKQFTESVEALIPLTQTVVDNFNALNLPASENVTSDTILKGSAILIQQHLRSQIPESFEIPGGLKLNRERALALGLIVLEGRESFENSLQVVTTLQDSSLIEYLTLEDKTVIVNEAKMETFIRQNSIIATTPEQVELFKRWQAAIDGIENFNGYLENNYSMRFRDRLNWINAEKWFIVNREGKLAVNFKLFSRLIRPKGTRVALDPVNS